MSRYPVLLPVLAVLLLTPFASAQFGVPLDRDESRAQPARIRELVAQYCRLDYEGARLGTQDWSRIETLVTWRTNPDYPLVNVISRFTIDQDPIFEHGRYTVGVHYRLLGRFNLGEGYSKDAANSNEDVVFTVAQTSGDWRITAVEPNYPRPSKAATLKWLNDSLAKAQDPAAKVVYQQAIRELEAPPVPRP
jgi:hypothetical protein